MRLACVDAVEVERPLGVLKTLHYRPELFGAPFSDALDLAMRGESDWTPGEREAAVLVAGGLTNRQIAGTLVIAERTADVHVSNILNKLSLTSRAQLAAWVVRHGLLA